MVFACCLKLPKLEEKDKPMIDIEKTIQDYIWQTFLDTKLNSIHRRFIRRANYVIDVPMNFFRVEDYIDPDDQPMQQRDTSSRPNTVAIATDFINNTGLDQTYKFRVEKTRKTTLNISIQKGYVIGRKTRVTIGLNKLGLQCGGFTEWDRRLNVTTTDNDTFEEAATMETTSDISIQRGSACVARVLLKETQISSSFRVKSKLTLEKGGVNTYIRRKTNNDPVFVLPLSDLEFPFQALKELGRVEIKQEAIPPEPTTGPQPVGDRDVKWIRNVVILETTGYIQGVLTSDQEIKLDETTLSQGGRGGEEGEGADGEGGLNSNDEEADNREAGEVAGSGNNDGEKKEDQRGAGVGEERCEVDKVGTGSCKGNADEDDDEESDDTASDEKEKLVKVKGEPRNGVRKPQSSNKAGDQGKQSTEKSKASIVVSPGRPIALHPLAGKGPEETVQ